MKYKPAKLILENGIILKGYALGKIGLSSGEVCFNTGMTGYQEILTDPSYCGQLITMTYPHIGNYGLNSVDIESSKIYAKGLIIKEACDFPSNFKSEINLDEYLKDNNIIGIQGIDTRYLTRIIRDEGAMNAIISSNDLNNINLQKILSTHPRMSGLDLVREVTCNKRYLWNNIKGYKIAVIDYGIKYNILRILESYGCNLEIFPASCTSDDILGVNPDGIFLSNGPGDPAAVRYGISTVKKLLNTTIPIFGICLGHQILALALGAKTYKLNFGHRGCNHPVKNIKNNKIEITSQNHGFSINADSIPIDVIVTHTSLNDNTIEGIELNNKPVFSVQYHPESSPGPHDSSYLFNNFIELIKKNKI
ncbi:glutamine-hydrolyzing carbamoyl-phosphate synthase small subunit [Candidatus Marinimicrobia bacterium]|nr:glutamine-hydrolyzing carbamoyl-phosphate synthase small subunit [Candidatus Neomarinimicrobiota bacterium]